MHPAKRKPACQRRIERIDAKRQSRGGQLTVKRGNIAAKLAKMPVTRLWLWLWLRLWSIIILIQLILFINIYKHTRAPNRNINTCAPFLFSPSPSHRKAKRC